MPRLVDATPKYRQHKASGQAVVTIQGHDFYLGPWDTKASKVEYDRIIGEWLAAGRRLPGRDRESSDLTIVELLARYKAFALQYYQRDGEATGTWNASTITFLYGGHVFPYTANVDLTAATPTIYEDTHSQTLTKQ